MGLLLQAAAEGRAECCASGRSAARTALDHGCRRDGSMGWAGRSHRRMDGRRLGVSSSRSRALEFGTSESLWLHWNASGWSNGSLTAAALVIAGQLVVGSRQPKIPSHSGGTTIDEEARVIVASIIVALKTHGLID